MIEIGETCITMMIEGTCIDMVEIMKMVEIMEMEEVVEIIVEIIVDIETIIIQEVVQHSLIYKIIVQTQGLLYLHYI